MSLTARDAQLVRMQIPKTNLTEVADLEISEPAASELLNWLPIDAMLIGNRPCIKWIEWPRAAFAEPFFSQTVERALESRPNSRQMITGIEALIQLEPLCDSIRPGGFIFHGSRCGSTLLANACRQLDGAVVISEAEVVEKIVSRFFSYPDDHSAQSVFNAALFRAALTALGQRRLGTEQKLFVKFSAVSTLHFRWVKRIWPNVPCVFMFRDPLEVITSNIGNPPEWIDFESIPEQSTAVTGLTPEDALKLDGAERCARGLGRIYTAGAELGASGAHLLDYAGVSIETLIAAVKFLGTTPTTNEADRISGIAKLYSKDSTLGRKFDPEAAQLPATQRVREVADRWALASYQRLKQMA